MIHVSYDFELVQGAVLRILESELESPRLPWTLQGFGMLRLILTPDKRVRLHVWDDRFTTPEVSEIHTHPWGMRSTIIKGTLVNQRILEDPSSSLSYMRQTIFCGEGGGLEGDPEQVQLYRLPLESYNEGETYDQTPTEIHVSAPARGCVTLVERKFGEDVDHAHVYWPAGREWITAEPRAATVNEITTILGGALAS